MENRYSESELITFLDWLADKGLLNSSTARSRKIAAVKVLGALDDHEKLNLRSIDREQTFQRFFNKYSKDFTPDSLSTYKSRFNSALDDFLRWVDNPAGFKIGSSSKLGRAKSKDAQESVSKKTSVNKSNGGNEAPSLNHLSNLPGSIVFPIPVRNDVVVQLHNLPMDLTAMEAERICAVIKALALPNGSKAN